MTTKPMKLIVRHADDYLWMMKSDDFRLHPQFNYTVVAKVVKTEGRLSGVQYATTDKGERYRVFPDWSVKAA